VSRRKGGGGGKLTELGYAAGWRLVRWAPAGVARVAFDLGADWATRRGGRGPEQLARNLRRVIGPEATDAELDALVKAAMRSYARYWREAFRLPTMTHRRLTETFHLDPAALDQLRGGAVVALPHQANWEHAGFWATGQGLKLISVAQRLQPEGLFLRFLSYREALGIEIVPHTGGDRPPLDVLREKVAAGYVAALVADRDMSVRGVPVTFFGHPARMPAGPALLSLQTGKPLFAAALWYEEDGTHATLTGPLTVPDTGSLAERVAALTQRMAAAFEAGIAAHPVDWHMLARLWLDDDQQPARRPVPAETG
jgi:lauroyl/myristoyl acyltransferase